MQEFATRKTIARRMGLRPLNCLLRKYRMAVRIMKLTAIILLAACLQLSAEGITQTVTISVKDAPLLSVLKAIEKQTDFVFFVNSKELKRAKDITITAKNLPLLQVLDMCFKDQPLTYAITGKWINIVPRIQQIEKTNDNISFTAVPLTKKINISGKVTDENSAPAQGVNITEKATGKGTSTNYKGEFELRDIDENSLLIVTSIGYDKMEIPVKGKTSISLQLKVAVGNLDEMQIIAYGTTSKRFSTGNIATIKSSDIEKQPVQNPLLALQGRVPGIEVTQLSGLSGGGVTVRIQGQNSIRSGLNPLIVVDGVPYPSQLPNSLLERVVQFGSPLNYLNPADIESIDVLKDADATAIYGSRAANGAILITTKKGKAGKTKIDLNLQQGWGEVGHFVDMLDTRQYLDMRYEALKNDAVTTIPSSNYDLTVWDTTRSTNWQKELIGGTAKYTNINASLSGGNATVQYLIGGTYNRQTTVFPGDYDDKRGALQFNINGQSKNQRLNIMLSGNYMYDRNNLPGVDLTQHAVILAPNAPSLYDDNGRLNWAPNAAGSSTWTNPLSNFASNISNLTKNLVSNLNINYRIVKGLTVGSSLGYTNTQSNIYLAQTLDFFRPESRPTSQRTTQTSQRDMTGWVIEPQLKYSENIWKGKFEALVGSTIQQNNATVLTVGGTGYSTDLLMKTLSAAQSVNIGLSTFSQSKFHSLFGRVSYIFNNKYILNLTGRKDGSSKFGDANKFNNFGSIGAGWIFSEENWVNKQLSFLSYGKLRGSYGTTGNDQIGDFGHLSLYEIVRPTILYQGDIGLQSTKIPNPHLQWEETRKLQGGFDLGFFHDRLLFGITYARNRSSNQLIPYVVPSTTGFTQVIENFPALIQNTSWEITFSSVNITSKDFKWSTNINLTVPRNKLLSFPGIEETSYASGFNGVIVGQPLGVSKAYQSGGVDPATGNYFVNDKDGKPTFDPDNSADKTVLISILTKFYGGMQNSISFKGFKLDVNIQFVRKKGPKDFYYSNGYQVSFPPGFFDVVDGLTNQPINVLNRWQKPGDDAVVNKFSTKSNVVKINYPTQSDAFYSYDASFVRIKNVSLSWQLPKNWLHRAQIQNASVYFLGQNLFTVTKYLGLDPENTSTTSLPPLRMLTVGVRMEL